MVHQLLSTKLQIPLTRSDLVLRPRLTGRLTEGLRRKLTLISAPAGFGKTTLISGWYQHSAGVTDATPLPMAWVSLDESDNDPARFWGYIIAALQTVSPGIGDAVGLLRTSPSAAIEPVLTTLLNDLALRADDVVLALDDYHVIECQPIHDALNFLIDHMPDRLHLVITSRVDPPLRLARLRALGQLVEVRAADLQFTTDEITTFLNQKMGLNLAPDAIAALAVSTEGWIAALQLIALALKMSGPEHGDQPPAASESIPAITGSHRYIVDYLAAEVFQRQPAHIQEFLLYTSILRSLNGPLCDAVVTARADVQPPDPWPLAPHSYSQAILEQLERDNLFVIPLDGDRRHYRYHSLFASFLQGRLERTQPAIIPELHRRASAWYERSGALHEAIHHAFAAQDFALATRLIEQVACAKLVAGEIATLLNWFDALPGAVVHASYDLCSSFAWALTHAGRLDAVEPLLQAIERLARSGEPAPAGSMTPAMMIGEIMAIRARAAAIQGDVQHTIEYSRQALAQLPGDQTQFREDIALDLGFAYLSMGDADEAHQAFHEAISIAQARNNRRTALLAQRYLAKLYHNQGQLRRAADIYEAILRNAPQQDDRPALPTAGVAHVGMGELLYEWNDLDAAIQHLREGVEQGRRVSDVKVLEPGYTMLARALHARGDAASAMETILEADQLARRLNLAWMIASVAATRAYIWLAQGQIDAAIGWARESGLRVDDAIGYHHAGRYLLLARVLIAQEYVDPTRRSAEEALRLLERLCMRAEAAGQTSLLVEALTLQALARHAQGRSDQALPALDQALLVAEPAGYVRTFLDAGAPIATLLLHLLETQRHGSTTPFQHATPGYMHRLLQAFGIGTAVPPAEHASTTAHLLAEPLSQRELDVLRLIAAGHSNQEIADALIVAVSTVRTHIKNIYGKLGARSRIHAIARAKELHLL